MVHLRPLRALRPPAELAARVAVPPYDVLDLDQALALAADPDSFVHATRPEVGVPGGSSAEEVHAHGRARLDDLVRRGVLVRDGEPAVWVHRMVRQGREQTGVVALVSVDDYDSGAIRTHEHTRPDKEADRVAHVDALDAHDEPVLLLHRPDEPLRDLLRGIAAGPGDLDVTDPDGVRHVLWRVADVELVARLVAAFDGLERLYVADGHHRCAAASAVRRLRAERTADPQDGGRDDGPGEVDAFLAAVFPADELTVLPYHRLVRDLDGLGVDDVLRRLAPDFEVLPSDEPVEPDEPLVFGLYLDGRWFSARVRADAVDLDDPLHRLDVSVLQERLLAPVFGIADPRRDERIAFLGGVHGVRGVMDAVDGGSAAVGITLRATAVPDLLEVSDAGEVMPPKSTWFEPKLRSGLLVHPMH